MRRFRRIRAFFTGHFREAFAPSPAPSDEPSFTDWKDREQPLPKGWRFEALYHAGRGMTPAPDPTDSEVAHADAIIVSYTDSLGKDYRTIHRANTRKDVATHIQYVTVPDSPPR